MIVELKELNFGEILSKVFNIFYKNFLYIFIVSFCCNFSNVILFIDSIYDIPLISSTINIDILNFGYLYYFKTIIQGLPTSFASSLATYLATGYLYLRISKYFRKNDNININYFKMISASILLSLFIVLSTFLIFPPFFLQLFFPFIIIIVMSESIYFKDSYKRANNLAKGSKWQILGLIIAVNFLSLALTVANSSIYKLVVTYSNIIIYDFINLIISILTTANLAILFNIIYFNQLIKKEDFIIENSINSLEN